MGDSEGVWGRGRRREQNPEVERAGKEASQPKGQGFCRNPQKIQEVALMTSLPWEKGQ